MEQGSIYHFPGVANIDLKPGLPVLIPRNNTFVCTIRRYRVVHSGITGPGNCMGADDFKADYCHGISFNISQAERIRFLKSHLRMAMYRQLLW